MKELFPEIEPVAACHIKTGGLHQIYVEDCGNPQGIPVVFLHGGPGAGSNENHRRYFNPDKYRIVIFDQRGTARSLPGGCVEENTTWHLIEDMERIRDTLNIEKWVIFGGSWGATLGLLYAQARPGRVLGMILRGTFLARQRDIDWFMHGAGKILPDYWCEFIGHIPEHERSDAALAWHQRVHGGDDKTRKAAVRAWSTWSARVVTYMMPGPVTAEAHDMDRMIREVMIETHYARNRYFIEEDQILQNVDRLPDVPVKIIHGRRDLTCPLQSSWLLHEALPHSEINIVENGGHLAGEPPMVDALINATESMELK